MTVTFQHTQDELLNFIQTPDRLSVPTWPSTLYFYGLLPIIFLIVAVGASFGLAIVVLLLVYVGGALTTHYQERLNLSAMLSESYLSRFSERITITIEAPGLRIQHRLYDAVFRWQAFSEIKRVGHYIMFQESPTERFHVPTRAFATDDEAMIFLDQARQFAHAANQNSQSDHAN